MRRAVCSMVAMTFLFSACGGGSSGSGGTSDTTTAQVAAERDAGEADRIGLHIYDFPTGWAVDNTSPPTVAVPDEFNSCAGGPIADNQLSARKNVTLRLNATVAFASQVSLVRDATALDARAARIDTEDFVLCMRNAMQPVLARQFPAGLTPGPSDARRGGAGVPNGTGVKVSMVLDGVGGGVPFHSYLVFVYLRLGRTEAVLAMFSAPDRPPPTLEDGLVRTLTRRLSAPVG